MGADLYIKSISDKSREKYEPLFDKAVEVRDLAKEGSLEHAHAQLEVVKFYNLMNGEGYFRDSYSSTSVMKWLGLSWWKDVTPLQNKAGEITPSKCKKLLRMIKHANLRLPTKEELIAANARVEDEGEDSVEGWHNYFKDKKAELEKFIETAIELNEPIEASL